MLLRDLLSEEFVVKNTMKKKSDFIGILNFLEHRGFMEIDYSQELIKVDFKRDSVQQAHTFLYHLILPYIESYWFTLLFFCSFDNVR
jgi:hypothetical protein